ncbi:MAG: LysM peptidoglycan-binding domain-containing protein, partial [Candidatus Saccharimonadales bacterium]
PLEVLRKSYPALCPKPHAPAPGREALAGSGHAQSARLYTVADGDTLFDIARHELGKASRWLEIYELNRDQLGDDFNYLAAGMQLQLPGDAPEPVASRPRRDAYLR